MFILCPEDRSLILRATTFENAVSSANENFWLPSRHIYFHHFLPHRTLYCSLYLAANVPSLRLNQNPSILSTNNESQSDSRRAATQDFYSTTVNALNAKDRSDSETARKLEESRLAAKKGASPGEPGPANPIREQAQAPFNVEIPIRDGDEDGTTGKGLAKESHTGEVKGVAGRTKIKGGEKWDMATGKEAAMQVDKEGEKGKDETKETEEEHEVEVELNAILKKGPSKLPPSFLVHDISK